MKRVFMTILFLSIYVFSGCEKSIEIVSDGTNTEDSESSDSHEEADDYVWDSSEVIPIILNGNSVSVESDKVTIDGSTVTIDSTGNYSLTGTLVDGQIIVNTSGNNVVRLILSGASISNSNNAPIYVKNAYKTIIVLDDNTENYLSDASSYIYENSDDEPNATLFSKDNLSIYGNGSLTVYGNYNDGISSKDGLVINSGNITVNAVDDGIRGKNYLIVKGDSINIVAGGDGLKSDYENNESMGYISIENGNFNISSGGDAVQAETNLDIITGEFDIISGGGSNYNVSTGESSKGIKAELNLTITGGNYIVNSADDALHSNDAIMINGGELDISSKDDGIHADVSVEINNADINISKSYEGIESADIAINESNVRITSSDDGFNATKGMATESNDNSCLTINSGYVYVNASGGDALDSNGNIVINGGTLLAHGPSSDPEVGMDYNGTCKISGGTTVISGISSHMTQAPSSSSSQNSILIKFNSRLSANSIVHIQDRNGNDLLTFAPLRTYQSIIFSSPELIMGSTYSIYIGGNYEGTFNDGLYTDGTYLPGTEYRSFTVSQIVTTLN